VSQRLPVVAGFQVSFHAMKRMLEMDVSLGALEEALRFPEQTYDQPNYGRGSRVYQKGGLAVAVVETPHQRVVKSVLWRTQQRYERKS
jgi:hypothetical protein